MTTPCALNICAVVGHAPNTLPTQARYSLPWAPTVARLEQGRAIEGAGSSSLMLTRRDHAALALLRLYGDDRRGPFDFGPMLESRGPGMN